MKKIISEVKSDGHDFSVSGKRGIKCIKQWQQNYATFPTDTLPNSKICHHFIQFLHEWLNLTSIKKKLEMNVRGNESLYEN